MRERKRSNGMGNFQGDDIFDYKIKKNLDSWYVGDCTCLGSKGGGSDGT